MDWGLHLGF